MDDKRNLIIAVLLTGLILFGWPYIASTFFPTAITAPETAAAKSAPAEGSATTGSAITSAAAPKNVPLNVALRGSVRVLIETPKLKGSVNLEGARIDDLQLLAHRTALPKDSPPVRLFAPSGTAKAHFARFGWVGKGIIAPDDKTIWTPSGNKLTPETPVTLSWTNADGQKFEIVLAIDKQYMITAEQRFTNGPTAEAEVATFGLLSRNGISPDPDSWNIHVGPMGVFDGTLTNVDYDDVVEAPKGELDYQTTGGWLGETEKYWLAALIPDQKVKTNASFKTADGYYWSQMVNANQTKVAAGATISQTSRLFAGAKEVETLNMYANKQGIPLLDYSIDWGWFWFIAIPFFWLLHWLFGMFGNFGVAIIGLTVIVRLFMFPIAQKQYASMAQMRAVQPKMKLLQERWKDDKPRMQQEIMKLYKDEKVNPLAGCLPVILQIPIFFALYKILMLSVEMRHQPFILWLRDLSIPDQSTAIVWNMLGTGIELPAMLAIGVFPILVGVTMWLQQRLSPQPTDEVQKQVMAIMPFFLVFIFAPLAAGLQVYYLFNNLISIAQTKYALRKYPMTG